VFAVISSVSAEGDILTCSTVTNNETLNDTTNDTSNETSNSTNSSENGTNVTVPFKAYWMLASSVAGANASDLHAKGITDIFVLVRGTTGKTYLYELQQAINKFNPVGIKVHAWIVCFKDTNGNFVDPSGYYCYTKSVVKTIKYWGKKKIAYKSWKKVKWKKVRGKWRYKWKKVTKYRYKYGWLYKNVYNNVTVKGYDQTFNNNLINFIKTTATYNVDGIHLDYVRYSGVASKNHAAWQEPGGETAAVNAVTSFVSRVNSTIKTINPDILLSAAVMPECANNAYYYGQDYGRLADYVDFFVPMIYEGNYNANNAWITSVTEYIVAHAKGKPVYAGLTTYLSDTYPTIEDPDLSADVQSAKLGGAEGFVLFRYGTVGYADVPE
jgi:hypothetical protein